MDFEKAYKQALERAKAEAIDGYLDAVALETIFPELRESEDERIRKAIVLGIKRCADAGSIFGTVINNEGVNYHDVLAWLEKQKEKKFDFALIKQAWYMEGYKDREFGKESKWIIKTGEGGPKHELNPKYGQPLAEMQKPDIEICPHSTKSKSYKETGYPSVTRFVYNKSDEKFIRDCANILKANDYEQSAERLLSMLKQKPAEWSEEDEDMIQDIIASIDTNIAASDFHEMEDWLKSLRPSWKPSEEQLEALHKVAFNLVGTGTETDIFLVQLYEQLKKL